MAFASTFGLLTLGIVVPILQFFPLVMFNNDAHCVDSGSEVPFIYRWLLVSPSFVFLPWFTGACMVYVVNQSRIRSNLTLLTYFVIGSFLNSWIDVLDFWGDCISHVHFKLAFRLLQYIALCDQVIVCALHTRLSLLRLRVLAPLVPVAAYLGEYCYKAVVIMVIVSLASFIPRFFMGSSNVHIMLVAAAGIVTLIFMTMLNGCVVIGLERCAREAIEEATQREVDECRARSVMAAAKFTRRTLVVTVLCAISSPLYFCCWLFHGMGSYYYVWRFAVSSSIFVDTIMIVGSALMLSGVVGPKEWDSSSALAVVATSAASQQRRTIEKMVIEIHGASAGNALALSSFMEGVSAKAILDVAVGRFRCVSWDVLVQHPEILIGGTPLDGSGCANELIHLSQPCELGECDAFFSHSWHDCGKLKWKALELWCHEFTSLRGRSPRLWLDKLCIDQTDIKRDLQCLPVFLAGCNALFVSSGLTYTSRLWCAMEMFVFSTMQDGHGHRGRAIVWLTGKDDDEREKAHDAWKNFDVERCDCFNEADKLRFLKVVSLYPGGADAFNRFIQSMAEDLDAPIVEWL